MPQAGQGWLTGRAVRGAMHVPVLRAHEWLRAWPLAVVRECLPGSSLASLTLPAVLQRTQLRVRWGGGVEAAQARGSCWLCEG